jgi:hypothetical protein
VSGGGAGWLIADPSSAFGISECLLLVKGAKYLGNKFSDVPKSDFAGTMTWDKTLLCVRVQDLSPFEYQL